MNDTITRQQLLLADTIVRYQSAVSGASAAATAQARWTGPGRMDGQSWPLVPVPLWQALTHEINRLYTQWSRDHMPPLMDGWPLADYLYAHGQRGIYYHVRDFVVAHERDIDTLRAELGSED